MEMVNTKKRQIAIRLKNELLEKRKKLINNFIDKAILLNDTIKELEKIIKELEK